MRTLRPRGTETKNDGADPGREDGAIMRRSAVFVAPTASVEKLPIGGGEILRELLGCRDICTGRQHAHAVGPTASQMDWGPHFGRSTSQGALSRIHNRLATDSLTLSASGFPRRSSGEDLAVNNVSDVWRALFRRAVFGRFQARRRWREVSSAQFDAFLRTYPRSLEQRHPICRKSAHREWMDASLGSWPANAVAKAWTRGRSRGYQIRSA